MMPPDRPRITITLEHDDDALRVTAVLEALGFHVTRAMPSATEGERRVYAVRLLESCHRLTGYEADALYGMLAGLNGDALADHMHVGRAAANFARNGVLVKLGVDDDAGVRRRAAECVQPIDWAMVVSLPANSTMFPMCLKDNP